MGPEIPEFIVAESRLDRSKGEIEQGSPRTYLNALLDPGSNISYRVSPEGRVCFIKVETLQFQEFTITQQEEGADGRVIYRIHFQRGDIGGGEDDEFTVDEDCNAFFLCTMFRTVLQREYDEMRVTEP